MNRLNDSNENGRHIDKLAVTPARYDNAVRPRRRRASVVLAVERLDDEGVALRRAFEASRLLGATLEVLHVSDQNIWEDPVVPRQYIRGALRSLNLAVEHRRALDAWVRGILGRRKGVQTTASYGDLGEGIMKLLDHINAASLIVLGGQAGHNAELVTNLVMATELPVFICRGETSTQEVLAVTDLRLGGYPVLRSAARMLWHGDGDLIALHNIPPAYFTPELLWTLGATPEVVRLERATKLEHDIADEIGVPIHAVVSSESETKIAIFSEANARDVDIVVIGLRCDQLADAEPQRAMVKEFLAAAQRSVLVAPVFHSRRTPRA